MSHVTSQTPNNSQIEITADEERGLPILAHARGISVAQARSELLTAKLRAQET
jgi:hypothetical protein